MAAGPPTKFRPEFVEQVEKLCKLGATNVQIGDFFGVHHKTIETWYKTNKEFGDAVKRGKMEADMNVADSMYNRAIGYSHPDVHISSYKGEVTVTPTTRHYPPDTYACKLWLINRQPDVWHERVEHVIKEQPLEEGNDFETGRRLAFLLERGLREEKKAVKEKDEPKTRTH